MSDQAGMCAFASLGLMFGQLAVHQRKLEEQVMAAVREARRQAEEAGRDELVPEGEFDESLI